MSVYPSGGPTGPIIDQDNLLNNGDDEGQKGKKLKDEEAKKSTAGDAERARAKIIFEALDSFNY